MPTNAEDQARTPLDFAIEGVDEPEGQGGEADQARAQVQPGQELGALPEEGGGEEGALLTPDSSGYSVLDDSEGNISKITFQRNGSSPVVVNRPTVDDSAAMLLWKLLETQRRGARKRRVLQTAINKAHACMLPFVSMHQSRERSACATLTQDGVIMPPKPIQWLTKLLPEHLTTRIQSTYFLQIDQHVTDRHGNAYVPAKRPNAKNHMKWRGSMLGDKFPHAVVSVKQPGEGVTTRTNQFMCGASNNVEITVRLKKRVENSDPVNCGESEVLDMITNAYNANQRANWGYLESKLVVYLYLEFADGNDAGTPVGANAFDKVPEHGAIFSPTESPPSYLNHGKLGFYEMKMERGAATMTFSFQDGVTSANLGKSHKNRLFRFVFKAINPFLSPLEGMTAVSSPFLIKSVLHNDVKSNERHVCGPDGMAVDSGPADTPK